MGTLIAIALVFTWLGVLLGSHNFSWASCDCCGLKYKDHYLLVIYRKKDCNFKRKKITIDNSHTTIKDIYSREIDNSNFDLNLNGKTAYSNLIVKNGDVLIIQEK